MLDHLKKVSFLLWSNKLSGCLDRLTHTMFYYTKTFSNNISLIKECPYFWDTYYLVCHQFSPNFRFRFSEFRSSEFIFRPEEFLWSLTRMLVWMNWWTLFTMLTNFQKHCCSLGIIFKTTGCLGIRFITNCIFITNCQFITNWKLVIT